MKLGHVQIVLLALASLATGCAVEMKASGHAGAGATGPQTASQPGTTPPPQTQAVPAVASAPPASQMAVANGKPLGCFKDQGDPTGTNGRDLNGFVLNSPGMTTALCTQTCADKGFQYAATQYAIWCFCGATYGKSGPASNCDMKCGGEAKEICGGAWANSVYQLR
jgi:hypothetical protein